MKLGRRTTLALLGALICFNLVLRYPASGHEVDVDSYFVHAITGTILDDGHAEWTVNLLSYFGWYPLSYPSAGPFALAGVAELTGSSIETSILLLTLLLGPIGILGAFVMAREVRSTNGFALCAAYLYGIAPRFLSITLWTASTRNLFMALLPIFVWTLLLSYRKRSRSTLVMLALSAVTLAATHRLVILVLVVFAAFLAAVMVLVLVRVFRIQFPGIFLKNSTQRAMPYLALSGVVGIAAITLVGTNILTEYSTGEIVSGTDVPSQLTNLAISIARSVGFALPLTLVGLVVLTRLRNKTVAHPFLAISLLCLVPTLFLRKYTGFYILPFVALFGALGIVGLFQLLRLRPRAASVIATTTLLVAAAFSGFVLGVETQRIPTLDEETYTTALYMRSLNGPGSLVANDGLLGVRVAAISSMRVLPVGGAGTTSQNPELLAYHFYSPDEVSGHLVAVPLSQLTIESDSLWTVNGIQAEQDWTMIDGSAYWQIPGSLSLRYAPAYYLESREAAGNFVAYNNVYCSNLGRSVNAAAYILYQNTEVSVWWIYSPGGSPTPGQAFQPCP